MITPDNIADGYGGIDIEKLFYIIVPIMAIIIVLLLLYVFHLKYNLKYNYVKKENKDNLKQINKIDQENKQE